MVGLKGPRGLKIYMDGVGMGRGLRRGDVTVCKGRRLVEGWGGGGLAGRVTIWIGL